MIKDKIKQIIVNNASIQIKHTYTSEDLLFKDKVVVITGGYGDIGLAIKDKMLRSKAKVVLIGRNETELKSYETDRVKTVAWNLTDISLAKVKVQEASLCFGKIDVWINNAGVISENDLVGSFLNAVEDDWDIQFNVNAKSLYFTTQEICRYFIENDKKGHICQVLSIDGIRNTWQIYGLSKRFGIGFTKGIAKEMASKGIVINGVAPGGVLTKMISHKMTSDTDLKKHSVPSHRLSTPEEIANQVWFLSSDFASQLIGEIIVCDGGDTL